MDVYDTQTLGFMVFGGFMLFSAVGITLFSTFSMKETSYEEALAKQRQQAGKAQSPLSDKKKKISDKKSKAKKKEEKTHLKPSEGDTEPSSEHLVENNELSTLSESEVNSDPEAEPVLVSETKADTKQSVPEPVAQSVNFVMTPSLKEKRRDERASEKPLDVKEETGEAEVEEKTPETPSKRRSKKKTEQVSVEVVDVPPKSLFKTLVSSLSDSQSLSESEKQKLIEIISKKVPQKNDQLAALKKQLEEKEKQLKAGQENVAAVKSRVHELTKELSSAKSKHTSLENKLKSEQDARGQEITALRASMQTSSQEHAQEIQKFKSKISSLQDEFEKGPNAELARLQQENSILRDALNQATSQAKSRQNAELAKLHQDVLRLTRELNERSNAQRSEEDRRKVLEAKMEAAEVHMAQTHASHVEKEQTLQEKFDQADNKLCETQQCNAALQAQLQSAKDQTKTLADLQNHISATEMELKDTREELEKVRAQLTEEKTDSLAEAVIQENSEEVEQLRISLKESKDQLTSQEKELTRVKEELESMKKAQTEENQNRINEADTARKEYASMIEQLESSLKEKEDLVVVLQTQLDAFKSAENTETEPAFENLEKDAHLISLEEELQQLKEEMEQMKTKSHELREKNYAAVETLAAAERLSEERLSQAKSAQSEVEEQLSFLNTNITNTLKSLFPNIPVETNQTNWLETFTHEAHAALANTDVKEMMQKLTLSEEGQRSLEVECLQYKSQLSEKENILQVLQKSKEEEELAWKSQMTNAEEQRQASLDQVKMLEEMIRGFKAEREDTEQLKGHVMLLEAQLEKQLETITISQAYEEEISQLKKLLADTQNQLLLAKAEAHREREELSVEPTPMQLKKSSEEDITSGKEAKNQQEETQGTGAEESKDGTSV